MSRPDQELDALERSLAEFFEEVRETETAPPELWQRVASRIEDADARDPRVTDGARHGVPRWLAAGAVAASLALVAIVVWNGSGGDGVASAEQILQRAETTATSPSSAGIRQLAVEQRFVRYFLSDAQRGVPSADFQSRAWFEAPNLQRLEWSYTELASDGRVLSEDSGISVWDGGEHWNYDSAEHTATVLRQDPNADIYEQGVFGGILPAQEPFLGDPSCRTATVTGVEEVAGRLADVVELSPSSCGFTLPGSDGRAVIWVDQDTGLVLKMAQFGADHELSAVLEVTTLEINGAIADDRFTFTTPAGAQVRDRRDQPLGMGTGFRLEPRLLSVDEARAMATFLVRAPSHVPPGFELQSVQLWWPGVGSEDHPTVANDWVLMRYGDDDGNWLMISQGFGGLLAGLASVAPPEIPRGTVAVRGAEAEWVDGSPSTGRRWEPGTMRLLLMDAGRVGGGWAIDRDGKSLVGSPLHIALASNSLTVDELVDVAESLE